ncbi:MAG TPA: hypothetical protein ENN40_02010 [Candidatus Aminicenantes bacterium]|nr:hypothetical protein [Candidatus Aminicenantes bacterium]
MKAVQAYVASFRGRTVAVAVYLWAAGLIFSLPAYLGFSRLISSTLGDSLLLEMTEKYGSFTVWLELFSRGKMGFRLLLYQLGVLVLVFALFSLFLSGGVYGVFVSRDSPRLFNFLSRAWKNLPAFFKLFLTCWLIWIPMLAVSLLGFVLLAGFLRESGNETLFRWLFLTWGGVTLIMIGYTMAVYDLSRIRRLQGVRGTWKSFRSGMNFVHRHVLVLITLFFLFLVPLLLIFCLTSAFSDIAGPLPHIVTFAGFQVLMWMRYFFKSVFMHAETRVAGEYPIHLPPELDAERETDTI